MTVVVPAIILQHVLRHVRDEGYQLTDFEGEQIIAELNQRGWQDLFPLQVGSPPWWEAMELASEVNRMKRVRRS